MFYFTHKMKDKTITTPSEQFQNPIKKEQRQNLSTNTHIHDPIIDPSLTLNVNRIGGVMVSVPASSAVDS